MATWYRAITVFCRIEEVEIVKETSTMVILKGNSRRKKRSDFDSFFETRAEAKEFLVRRAENRVRVEESHLERAKEDLETARGL